MSAILAMAEALELEVTAEGIETREQLAIQRAQGYYLGRPMPASATDRLVSQGRTWLIPE